MLIDVQRRAQGVHCDMQLAEDELKVAARHRLRIIGGDHQVWAEVAGGGPATAGCVECNPGAVCDVEHRQPHRRTARGQSENVLPARPELGPQLLGIRYGVTMQDRHAGEPEGG